MAKQESPQKLPQREADRRKRQAAALKANLKRRKNIDLPPEPASHSPAEGNEDDPIKSGK
jgi:hypothetical protein